MTGRVLSDPEGSRRRDREREESAAAAGLRANGDSMRPPCLEDLVGRPEPGERLRCGVAGGVRVLDVGAQLRQQPFPRRPGPEQAFLDPGQVLVGCHECSSTALTPAEKRSHSER